MGRNRGSHRGNAALAGFIGADVELLLMHNNAATLLAIVALDTSHLIYIFTELHVIDLSSACEDV